MLVHLSRMYNVLFGLLFATVREIGGYGDTLPIPLSVVAFGPLFRGLGLRPVGRQGDPGRRPILVGGRSFRTAQHAIAWVAAGAKEVD